MLAPSLAKFGPLGVKEFESFDLPYIFPDKAALQKITEGSVGKRLFERDSERWMQVEWAEQPKRLFVTAVTLLVRNGKGVLAQVASAVSHAEADITHIEMGNEPASPTTELTLLIAVRDRLHLADVMRTLKRAPSVQRVARVKP